MVAATRAYMIVEHLRRFYRRPREIWAIDLFESPETYPGLALWCEHDTRIRFFRMPSFQPHSVWVLQLKGKTAHVRRIEWDHVADAQLRDAMLAAPPTTFGADAQLPFVAAKKLLDDLASISLPPFLPVATLGIDGTTFAIGFGNSWRSASLSWWGNPPEPWQPLALSYERAISLFEEFLPVSTLRNPQIDYGREPAL